MNFRPILMFQGALFLALIMWNAFVIGNAAITKKAEPSKYKPLTVALNQNR